MKPIKLPKEQRELITENIRAYFEAERGKRLAILQQIICWSSS